MRGTILLLSVLILSLSFNSIVPNLFAYPSTGQTDLIDLIDKYTDISQFKQLSPEERRDFVQELQKHTDFLLDELSHLDSQIERNTFTYTALTEIQTGFLMLLLGAHLIQTSYSAQKNYNLKKQELTPLFSFAKSQLNIGTSENLESLRLILGVAHQDAGEILKKIQSHPALEQTNRWTVTDIERSLKNYLKRKHSIEFTKTEKMGIAIQSRLQQMLSEASQAEKKSIEAIEPLLTTKKLFNLNQLRELRSFAQEWINTNPLLKDLFSVEEVRILAHDLKIQRKFLPSIKSILRVKHVRSQQRVLLALLAGSGLGYLAAKFFVQPRLIEHKKEREDLINALDILKIQLNTFKIILQN